MKLRKPPGFFELADLISPILACNFNFIAVAIMMAKKDIYENAVESTYVQKYEQAIPLQRTLVVSLKAHA